MHNSDLNNIVLCNDKSLDICLLANRLLCAMPICSPTILTSLYPSWRWNSYLENEVPDLTAFTSSGLFATHLPLVSLPTSSLQTCVFVHEPYAYGHFCVTLLPSYQQLRPKENGPNSLEETFVQVLQGSECIWALLGSCFGILEVESKLGNTGPDEVIFFWVWGNERSARNIIHLKLKRLAHDFSGRLFSPGGI